MRPSVSAVLRLIDQLELCRLLERQRSGAFAFENPVDVIRGLAQQGRQVRPVRHEAARRGEFPERRRRGEPLARRELNDLAQVQAQQRIDENKVTPQAVATRSPQVRPENLPARALNPILA